MADDDRWPLVCMCNDCGHEKAFASWEAMQADPLCDVCGEHCDDNGYCCCSLCSKPAGMEPGEAATLAQARAAAAGGSQ